MMLYNKNGSRFYYYMFLLLLLLHTIIGEDDDDVGRHNNTHGGHMGPWRCMIHNVLGVGRPTSKEPRIPLSAVDTRTD